MPAGSKLCSALAKNVFSLRFEAVAVAYKHYEKFFCYLGQKWTL
jgi:hypothetical protein